jgi:hypothetical protein
MKLAVSIATWSSVVVLGASTRVNAEEFEVTTGRPQLTTSAWSHGDPVPDGYREVRKHTLTIVGTAVLGGGYVLSSVTGLGLMASCSSFMSGGDDGGDSDSSCHKNISNSSAAWLLVPVAGPFVALTRSDVRNDSGGIFWSVAFGTLQVVGAGLLTYDWLNPRYGLEKSDEFSLALSPVFDGYNRGLLLSGRF